MLDGLRAGELVGVVDETLPAPRVIRPADTESRLGWRRGPNGLAPPPPGPGEPCPTCGHMEPVAQAAGGLELDERGGRVLVGRHPLPLTPLEYALLAELLRQPGRLVPHLTLARRVWGEDILLAGDHRNLVMVHVERLRKKLAQAGVHPGVVETVLRRGLRMLVAGETPRPVGNGGAPRLRRACRDGLFLNWSAWALLGRPARVALAYDAAARRLCVRAAPPGEPGLGVTERPSQHGVYVRCSRALLASWRIGPSWTALVDLVDGVLVAVVER